MIDFILGNFTNTLPFADSEFNIALLSYGTVNGTQLIGPITSYEGFCEAVNHEWEISQKFGMHDVDLRQ